MTKVRKLLYALHKRTGFKGCPTNSRLSHQVGTCFMLSPEVWLGKPLSQARIQGQRKRLFGSCSNKPARRAAPEQLGSRSGQSRTLATLTAQPSSQLGALRSNINLPELRALLPQPAGNTEWGRNLGMGSSHSHKAQNRWGLLHLRPAMESCICASGKHAWSRHLTLCLRSPSPKREEEWVAECNPPLHEHQLSTKKT